jgi:hypothetical protein
MDPNFDFLQFFASNSNDTEPNPFFNDLDNQDSPYLSSKFSTTYMDSLSFSTKFSCSSKISFLTLNIQSLPAKYNELCELITLLSSKNCAPSAICLQEIWNVNDPNQFPLPGYQPLIYNSRTLSQGGGLEFTSNLACLTNFSKTNLFLLKNFMSPSSLKFHYHTTKKLLLVPYIALTQNTLHYLKLNNLRNSTKSFLILSPPLILPVNYCYLVT